jgi:hypothetical protein
MRDFTLSKRARPFDHGVSRACLHIRDRDFCHEHELVVVNTDDLGEGSLYVLKLSQVARDLDILVTLQGQPGTIRGLHVGQDGVQLRRLADDAAFFGHEIWKVYIHKFDPLTVVGVSCQALPGKHVTGNVSGQQGLLGAEREGRQHLQASSEIDNDLGFARGPLQKVSDGDIDHVQSQMVAAVDQGCPSLELLDKEAEKVRLIGIVDALYTPLGDNAAAVGLDS